MLLDPRNGPGWDLPAPHAPPKTYVIASTPRTGSTLLSRMLWDTGCVGAPKEYLNPMQLRDWEVRLGTTGSRLRHRLLSGRRLAVVGPAWSAHRLAAHLARVRQRRSGGGWFGLKLHHHHLGRLTRPADRWVFLTRTDQVAQAVSWARALQTGQWIGGEAPRPARYSRWLIQRCLNRVKSGESGWEAFFLRIGVSPLRLKYEALTASPGSTLCAALAHLAVSDTNESAAVIPTLVSQTDATSSAWIARFKSEK
ncbi:MAG: LPS sulfotransferase NodH [Myxococcota bacterium]|jgi:LPS sulfotransferase NodH